MKNRYIIKMISVIKSDGFFPGIIKIMKGLWALFKYSPSARVLFISSGAVGDSWRFRVYNVAEELRLHDISASITVQENIWLSKYPKNFKVFIFHRVSNTPQIRKMIKQIKSLGKEIIFETDDLIFNTELLKNQDFFKNISEVEKKFYENGIGKEILSDQYVTTCTTTTSFLADKLREYEKKVFVVRNKLSQKDLKIANKILNYKREIRDTVRIGYFSGTMSHNKDLATAHDALIRIMEKYPMVELFFVGPVGFADELNKFRDRIKILPHVPREKHFKNILNVDINIAPLEINNPFCEAKSELKFFEAGIVRIPTVAAATSPFKEAIYDGEDGFVANGSDEWFEKLEKLIVDKDLRELMGDKAREKSIKEYSTENSEDKDYYAYLKSKIK